MNSMEYNILSIQVKEESSLTPNYHMKALTGVMVRIYTCIRKVKNLNFVAGMTRRFVSAKRLIRYFPNSSKLVEHRAQSPIREVKMLAVWPSIAEGFPTAKFTSYMQ